ncbi:MAG: hypothetical protein ACKVJH_05840 [Flavobacteriales bacterium]
MLNEKNAVLTHIWECEAKCGLPEIEKFCAANASKYVFELNEEGTIRFEWFIAADNKMVTLIETFTNGAAAKVRIGNHMGSHLLDEFPEVFDLKKLIVLGDIDPEMEETYAAFQADVRPKIGGFLKS